MLLLWVTVGLSLLLDSKEQNIVKNISSQLKLKCNFLKGLGFFFIFYFIYFLPLEIKGCHLLFVVMVKLVSVGGLIDRSWHHSELTPPPQTWWLSDPQPFTAPLNVSKRHTEKHQLEFNWSDMRHGLIAVHANVAFGLYLTWTQSLGCFLV